MVDYALRRRALLADVQAGRVAVAEVCDANPYLLQAARFHGEPSDRTCPVCRRQRLTLVSWVFGDELERLAERYSDVVVHVVEVCQSCSWNHLVLSYVTGTGDSGQSTRRKTAAE